MKHARKRGSVQDSFKYMWLQEHFKLNKKRNYIH